MASNPQPAVHTDDVADWTNRVKEVINKPAILSDPRPAGAAPWKAPFFGCFDPVDLCFITCCVPCVTFGKTHHRLRKDPQLKDYSPVNVSCLGFWASSYCCLHWLPLLIQRHEINEKYNLQGDFATDCLKAWCCGCCDLMQQEKEAVYLTANATPVETSQPIVKESMSV